MSKQISIVDRVRLEVRGEFFNVFNHANFGLPNSSTGSLNFGSVSTAADPRLIQVSGRLLW